MFAEENPPPQDNPVAPVPRSPEVRRKQATRKSQEGLPVLGFQDLLERLGTLCAAELETGSGFAVSVLTRLTLLQERAFSRLGLKHQPAPKPRNSEVRAR